MKTEMIIATSGLPVEKKSGATVSIQNSKFKIQNFSAFTLVELLTVIAIIAVLAAFLFPIVGGLNRRKYINTATAEMNKIETAIDAYKSTYGFYPPDNTNTVNNLSSALTNQLYYELVGTTNTGSTFQMLDGSSTINSSTVSSIYGISGFANCSKYNSNGEDSSPARNFLGELKPNQVAFMTNSTPATNNFLVVSVGGPDTTYQPLGMQSVNPWRYVCPGTNNPSSYDLWVQLVISGKTNLVCNWSKQVQINSSLP